MAIRNPQSAILNLLFAFVLLTFSLLTPSPSGSALASEADLEDRVRSIAAELRCVVCQNLSVADSPSELAQQMRGVVREQLQAGKSAGEIKAYFVSKYGDWVLLAPPARGVNWLVWVLPFAAGLGGIGLVLFTLRRWTRKKDRAAAPADPALLERLEEEAEELDFDYRAGKLSEKDYGELSRSVAAQAGAAREALGSKPRAERAAAPGGSGRATPRAKSAPRAWQIAAGGAFLLLFGVTLGVVLTKSLKPRQESITGDFLTGTDGSIPDVLAQGRRAFERGDWSQAIEAFKRVLALDPSQPEAHAYMGWILSQGGHADGALMAFDRALAGDPNLPLALWGKGMVLYRIREDYSAAREVLEKLLPLLPPGAEKDEIQKTVGEISRLAGAAPAAKGPKRASQAQITGTVSIDPALRSKVDGKAVLFIIARPAGAGGGAPLAVKKISRPVFPLSYTLGTEDVMMPGASLSGKVAISARLDQDGNPLTREPGNLVGEYRRNPVEAGSRKIDIVIDRAM